MKKNKPIKSPYIKHPISMTSPKSVALTIGERLASIKIFDGFKGNLTTLSALLDDVKKISMSEEEWTAAGLVKTQNPDGTEQWKWNDTGTKDVELQKESVDYLLAKIKERSDAGDISLADVSLISLETKLK